MSSPKKKSFYVFRQVRFRYGKFLTRETYMLLNISENDDGSKAVVISYWLGSETTMDKSGGAAFRIGELAGYLQAMSRANEVLLGKRWSCFVLTICRFIASFLKCVSRKVKSLMSFELCSIQTRRSLEDFMSSREELRASSTRSIRTLVLLHCIAWLPMDTRTKWDLMRTVSIASTRSCWMRAKVGTFFFFSFLFGCFFFADRASFAVVWVWHGANATYFDRFKAVELASKLANKERMGRSRVVQIEDDEAESRNPTADFWKHFGLVSKEKCYDSCCCSKVPIKGSASTSHP